VLFGTGSPNVERPGVASAVRKLEEARFATGEVRLGYDSAVLGED
jgi:hypothetical protein